MLKLVQDDPYHSPFLIKWKHKLDIEDTNIYFLRNTELKYKEIVISYKTIFQNTYSILVMDLSSEST